MPLRLNLYHEVIKTRALKRRDPLKISIYVISAIAACCAGWYMVQLFRFAAVSAELGTARDKFAKIEPQGKAAKKREDELNVLAGRSALLGRKIEERFYWAPLLSQIGEIVPYDVQITRFAGEISPGNGPRRVSLMLDGLSAGADARKVAEDLRKALFDRFSAPYKNVTSTFRSLEDGSESVLVDGHQAATAIFGINIQFTLGDNKPAAPTRQKKR